ncbi:hypothetical protein MMH89_03400 [Candidatus Comchoanobacter bicostacola]|uniref:Uncharacterized protein n=1 Tax=Candidatus Comchoanobacter bicostacola TaxID=2919598 RepID=A0ABY5DIS6_9GAMM|nr:hypothetical protein [Candidatus Comchoanobacter bicostacola]UTC24269.1 hypothetical protein MMH89_03400 [Candidatus Comchoanobacter bicostacola]
MLQELSQHLTQNNKTIYQLLGALNLLLPKEQHTAFTTADTHSSNCFTSNEYMPMKIKRVPGYLGMWLKTLKDVAQTKYSKSVILAQILRAIKAKQAITGNELNVLARRDMLTGTFISQLLSDDATYMYLLNNYELVDATLQKPILAHPKLPKLFSDAVTPDNFNKMVTVITHKNHFRDFVNPVKIARLCKIALQAIHQNLLTQKLTYLIRQCTLEQQTIFIHTLGKINTLIKGDCVFNLGQLVQAFDRPVPTPILKIMATHKIWDEEMVYSPNHFFRLDLSKQRELFLNPRLAPTLLNQRAYASQLFVVMRSCNPTELNELFEEVDHSELVSLLTNLSFQDERVLDLKHTYSNQVIYDPYAPITAIKRMTDTHSQKKLALNFLKFGTETNKVAKLAELAPSQYKNFVLHYLKSKMQASVSHLSDEMRGFIEHEISKNSDISQKTIRALIRYQAADSCELLGTVSNPELLATIATTITPAYQLNLDLCPNILAYLREQVVSHWDRYTYNPKIDFFKSASYQSSLLRRLNDFSIREKVLSGIEHPGLQTYHAYTSADKIQLNDEIVNAVLNTYPDSISISAIQQYCSSSTCLTLQQTLCAVIRGSESPYKALEQHPVIKLSLQRILESSSPGMSYEDIVAKNHTELFIKLLNIKEVQDNLSGCYQYDQHAHLKHLRDALCDCIKQAAKDKALYRTGLNASLFAQVLSLGHSYKEIMKSYTLSVLARVLLVSTDKKVKTTIKTHCSGWTYFMSRVYAFFLRLFRPKYCSKLCKQQISATTLNSRLIATIAKHDDISSKLVSGNGPLPISL